MSKLIMFHDSTVMTRIVVCITKHISFVEQNSRGIQPVEVSIGTDGS